MSLVSKFHHLDRVCVQYSLKHFTKFVLFWKYSLCPKVTAVKPVNQSKLTNEGKNDERDKHETENAITSAE